MSDLTYAIAKAMPLVLFLIAAFVAASGLLLSNNPVRELYLAAWLAVPAAALAFVAKDLEARQ